MAHFLGQVDALLFGDLGPVEEVGDLAVPQGVGAGFLAGELLEGVASLDDLNLYV